MIQIIKPEEEMYKKIQDFCSDRLSKCEVFQPLCLLLTESETKIIGFVLIEINKEKLPPKKSNQILSIIETLACIHSFRIRTSSK